jgi:hypothetical protein
VIANLLEVQYTSGRWLYIKGYVSIIYRATTSIIRYASPLCRKLEEEKRINKRTVLFL